MTGVGEEAAVTVGGNVKGAAAAGGAQSDPAAPQLRSRRRCRRAESGPSGVSTPVTAAPRIIARWEPASVPISRRMGTAGPARQMEYYPAFKKEILPRSTTRMRLEDVTPSEISQSQKDKCVLRYSTYMR